LIARNLQGNVFEIMLTRPADNNRIHWDEPIKKIWGGHRPPFSLEGWGRILPFKDQAVLERYLAALRKAGLK